MRTKNIKVSLIGIVILVLVFLYACNTAEAKGKQNYFMEYIREYDDIEEWRDTETGVHYLIFDKKDGYGGMGGICPRYNADGTLYVD